MNRLALLFSCPSSVAAAITAVGIMGGQRLEILELDAARMTTGTIHLTSTPYNLPAARYRSLVQGPDGSLYIATDERQIWRVVPN